MHPREPRAEARADVDSSASRHRRCPGRHPHRRWRRPECAPLPVHGRRLAATSRRRPGGGDPARQPAHAGDRARGDRLGLGGARGCPDVVRADRVRAAPGRRHGTRPGTGLPSWRYATWAWRSRQGAGPGRPLCAHDGGFRRAAGDPRAGRPLGRGCRSRVSTRWMLSPIARTSLAPTDRSRTSAAVTRPRRGRSSITRGARSGRSG